MQQILLGAGGGIAVSEVTATNATNIVLATVFGSDWAATVDKIYNVPSGVTIGATAGNAAILVSSGMGGTLVINVAGAVQGHHGTGGSGGSGPASAYTAASGSAGGAGGHAISVASSGATINNTGSISGGGGGGGGGGQGGRRQQGFFLFAGGAGGAGGLGQGYNQSNTNGAAGSPNGQGYYHVGAGGAGGNGGTFGNAGGNGSNGISQSGNYGSGGSGGAAGKAINNGGASWTNGTTSGTYHGSYT